ncbi:carbohydrate kinase family protein [Aliiroseovarius sp.]|uniref:carbohydrate kinase family protein n=1 Tax=Aliiroseovarius sp. TaxID=1872442 RepID=UPI003BAB09C2
MILCCGEALIDMIPTPTTSGPDGFVPHPGGAVFNTAVALGRLGVEAGLLTGLSTDMFGAQLTRALADSHVDATHVIRSDRPTTLAFVQLTNGQARYAFFDENSAGRMLTPADLPALPDSISALYFGGISLACEPGADAYAALLACEGDTRAVMIDPNIRPGFIQDEPTYRARLKAMIAASDIVKLSDEDLDWLIPGPEPVMQKAAGLSGQGASLVIVTRGSAGATGLLADGTQVTVPAQKAQVVDTVGAGDTFNAGVLAKLSELGRLSKEALRDLTSDEVEAALSHGAKVAAITVSRAGANPPWAHELAEG